MAQTKKQSKIWVLLVSIVVIAALVVGLVFIIRPTSDASATMQCNVNPSVQFVLDGGNKVIGVNALNEDGEKLVANVNFIGKSAEESAKLFVEIAAKCSFINLNTTGTRVDIIINAPDTNKYLKLKDKVTTAVNKFFDENGIVAGAVTTLSSDIKSAVEKLGVNSSEFADLTQKEVLELLQTTTKELENTSITLREGFMDAVEFLKTTYKATCATLEQTIKTAKENINKLTGAAKELAQEILKQAEKDFKENKLTFEQDIKDLIETLKENSAAILAALKTGWNALVLEGKTALDEHKTAFESNKTAVENSIKAYRDSLAA